MEKKLDMKFNQIIKSIIVEQGRYEILKKTYTTPKKKGEKKIPAKMTVDELDKLVIADPTTIMDGDTIKKAGKYVNWIIKKYLDLNKGIDEEPNSERFKREYNEKVRLFFEDLYKVTEDLKKFDRFKDKLESDFRDINKLTIDDLNNLMLTFSLEKTKATKSEKEQAAVTYEHPGADIIFRGSKWTVVKISEGSKLGKDAACYYGGYDKKPSEGETSWCTSSPGLSYFDGYIKDGPLYVILPNEPESFTPGGLTKGNRTGLPAKRYQFHFPSSQFMDANDRQINLIKFLKSNPELLKVFKPEFIKGISKNEYSGSEIYVEYPKDVASKFIMLYGIDEFLDDLPLNMSRLDFYSSDPTFSITIPNNINRFKNLIGIHLDGVVKSIPDEIGDLKNLMFLSLPNNKNLKSLPEGIAKKNPDGSYSMENLTIITVVGGDPNIHIPESVIKMIEEKGIQFFK